MSHFLVMVIGSDPEQQLAPFHEFECTGRDDEFVQELDLTEEARKEYAQSDRKESLAEFVESWYGSKPVPHGQQPNLLNGHKYGYSLLNEAGEVVKVVDRTNPNAKWDWWTLGGRYSGRLQLKVGGVGAEGRPGVFNNPVGIDQARKGDIDFADMRRRAAENAAKEYDKFAVITSGLPWPESWEVFRARFADIEEARTQYRELPMIKVMNESREFILEGPEDYGQDKQAYIDAAIRRAGVPFAFVKDRQWWERGKMGWWAMVTDEKDEAKWQDEFWKMFDALPDDTLISMVDCHI